MMCFASSIANASRYKYSLIIIIVQPISACVFLLIKHTSDRGLESTYRFIFSIYVAIIVYKILLAKKIHRMVKRNELNSAMRNQAIGLMKGGHRITEISRLLNINVSTLVMVVLRCGVGKKNDFYQNVLKKLFKVAADP